MSSNSISLVLPAFNEADNLASTVSAAASALADVATDYEIIIIDDGSTDNTADVCRDIMTNHREVRVISHSHNRGYGAALRSAFAAARYDVVFLTDADGQFRFDHLEKFLSCMEGADAVVGYRQTRADRWHRKLISKVGNWIVRRVFALRARDIDCAYKLLRRDALLRLPLSCDGALISTELLLYATRADWKIKELGVPHFARRHGTATGAKPVVIWHTLVEFIKLCARSTRRPLILRAVPPPG
jgi:glycosyltransferase involved in cell wall biosynthesis